MTDNKLFNVFVNANKTAYYEFFINAANTVVKYLRNANVEMYYLNQAEKFAAELRQIANDNIVSDFFDIDYFNNRVSKGINQFKGWCNNDSTPNEVRIAVESLFVENN